MTREQFQAWIDAVKTYFTCFEEYEMGFGSNEELLFESYEYVMYGIEWTELTQDEYDTLYKIFGRCYNKFPSDDLWLEPLPDNVYAEFKSRHESLYNNCE